MFDRLSGDGRDAMARSREEAHRLGHDFIAPVHVVLAVLATAGSVPAQALRNLRIDSDVVRTKIGESVPHRPATNVTGQLPFTPGAKVMLETALEEAKALGHGHLSAAHLFLGALRADDTRFLGEYVMKAFRDAGLKPDEVRAEVLRLLAPQRGST